MKKFSAILLMLLISGLAFGDVSLDSFQQLATQDEPSPYRIIEHDNSGRYLIQRGSEYFLIEQDSFTNINEALLTPLLTPLSIPPFTPLFMPPCAGIQQSADVLPDPVMVDDGWLVTGRIAQHESDHYRRGHKPEFVVEAPEQNIVRKSSRVSGVYVERHFNSATTKAHTLRMRAMFFIDANINASTCLAQSINGLALSTS